MKYNRREENSSGFYILKKEVNNEDVERRVLVSENKFFAILMIIMTLCLLWGIYEANKMFGWW